MAQLHLQVLEMCMPNLSKLIDIMDQLQYVYHRSGTITIYIDALTHIFAFLFSQNYVCCNRSYN